MAAPLCRSPLTHPHRRSSIRWVITLEVRYDEHMKRTTVVLPDDLAALLERERRRRGVSAAAVVREALEVHLNQPTGPLSFIGIGWSGERDIAQRAEEILDQEWGSHLAEEMGRGPHGMAPVVAPGGSSAPAIGSDRQAEANELSEDGSP